MNVSRRLPDNTVNPKEPNAQQLVMTSAGIKNSFAYIKLIDMFENSIINPRNSFVIGTDYRIPIMHGLLDKGYVNTLKMSPSFNEESFAREYMSLWGGSSEDSWYDFDKMQKYRKLKNPENRAKNIIGSDYFYLLSVDVGRLGDQTVCSVFRVHRSSDGFRCSLVNIYVLGREAKTKHFAAQAADLKELIEVFKPLEVVMDTNGLGVGLADQMITTQIGYNGKSYPAYGFKNDDEYKKIQPIDAQRIIYGIKANAKLNSKIHSNAYSRISSGSINFLIKEQEAKSYLLSTKKGQNMSLEKRIARLLPHEMTTKLFEEMANLRRKVSGPDDVILEQINSRVPKDKYSSFSYGLWRIKELEDEYIKKYSRYSDRKKRQLVFYSEG